MTTRPTITRTFALDDISIRADGKGRTVVAYAAVFDVQAKVFDPGVLDRPYLESVARTAFNKVIADGTAMRAVPLFNHGKTVYGTPAAEFSLPLGVPEEVKADGRGLLTVTRYAKDPLADRLLELINEGAITEQSFRGPIFRMSQPRPSGEPGMDMIELTELGLIDYGPATFAAHRAEIVGVRANLPDDVQALYDSLTPEHRAELARMLATDAAGTRPDAAPPANESTTDAALTGAPPGDLDLLTRENARRRLDIL